MNEQKSVSPDTQDLWATGYSADLLLDVVPNRMRILPRRGFYCLLAVALMLAGIFVICVAGAEAVREAKSASVTRAMVLDAKGNSEGCLVGVRYLESDGTGYGKVQMNSCPALGESLEVRRIVDENGKELKLEAVDFLTYFHDYKAFGLGAILILASLGVMYLVINELRIGLAISSSGFTDEGKIVGILRKDTPAGIVIPVFKTQDGRFLKDFAHQASEDPEVLRKLLGKPVRLGLKDGYFLMLDHVFRRESSTKR